MIVGEPERIEFLCAYLNSSLFRSCFKDNFPEYSGNAYRLFSIFMQRIPAMRADEKLAKQFVPLVALVQFAKRHQHISGTFLEDLIDACVMECYFRDHMAERDLLFLDDLAPHLAKYDSSASQAKQAEFLEHLYRTLNAPAAPIRNRLIRLTADSPDLLAIIKEEGKA